MVTSYAGSATGVPGSVYGPAGPATSASLKTPVALAVDSKNNIYILDQGFCSVFKVDTTGALTLFAGIGTCVAVTAAAGDGGAATSAG